MDCVVSHIAVRRCSLEFASVHKLLKRRRKSSRIGPQASAPGLLKPIWRYLWRYAHDIPSRTLAPRYRHGLTDTRLRNSKPIAKPYKLSDGDGMYCW